LAEDGELAFIIRLNSDESARRLFVRKWLYVGVKRGWSKGSKILIASKSDTFIGSGIIARLQPLEGLDENERTLCVQRNWSTKLLFASLARFVTPVAISVTPVSIQNPITLHGSEIAGTVASKIEELATIKIIT
jgi:hypothetical protein